jgi:hypothetical protein
LATRRHTLGQETIVHDVSVLDPEDVFAARGGLAEISSGERSSPSLPPETTATQRRKP